jgi:hypothetical protein
MRKGIEEAMTHQWKIRRDMFSFSDCLLRQGGNQAAVLSS